MEILKRKIQFFGDNSNLHGVNNVFSLSKVPFFKRLFWLIILISCCLGFAAVLQGALRLYSEDLVSFSVETTYLTWDTPFPAVTVCEITSDDRVNKALERNGLPRSLAGFFKDVAYWNRRYCRNCNSCNMNQSCFEDYKPVVREIRRNCSELLNDQCWWGGEAFNCCDRFFPVATEYGTCYSFNNKILNNNSVLFVNRKIGLPNLLFSAKQPFLLRVHAPDERISVSMDHVLAGTVPDVPLVSDFEAVLKAEETKSDGSVTALPVAQRGCLFEHERPGSSELWPFPEYTYNACVLFCRAKQQADLCNCTHYFMPNLGEYPSCDLQGMGCLNSNKDVLVSTNCKCPMACDEIVYKLVHIFNTRRTTTPELLKRGTRARIRLGQLPSLRVRRQAIRNMMGLVVDIGGVGGVFFGASLLSVLEILYLLCIRRG